jgi:lysozyme family protein
MSDFVTADALLDRLEGGWAPKDNSAGAVNYGITERWYRETVDHTATAETIRTLTYDRARELKRIYWWPTWGRIADNKLAQALYITAFNTGPRQATLLLQRTLNTLAAGLAEDGKFGPKTLAAIEKAEPDWIVDRYKDVLLAFYKNLALQDPAQYADDLPGWKVRVAAL